MFCEKAFADNAPFYHVYSSPPEKELLCISDGDYKEMTNSIALSATESGAVVVAYAIMSNHLHNLLATTRDKCLSFIDLMQKRIAYFCRKAGRAIPLVNFKIAEIENLRQMRDEIAYIIRNPYAVRSDVNPFSYPWCTGYLYFNGLLPAMTQGVPAAELPIRTRREIKHVRDADIHPSLTVLDGVIVPSSFVNYSVGMSMFENARQFIWWATRNVEAYTATAARLGESALLTDEEVYLIAVKYSLREFGTDKPRLLPQDDKTKLIRTLKYEFGATNKQLSRCTGIALPFINEMFPDRLHQ